MCVVDLPSAGLVPIGLKVEEDFSHFSPIRPLRLGIEQTALQPAGTLSGGQRRRLDIALGLVHRPPLLFLDEPTVALDPQVRRRIWSLVQDMARNGVTVFLTTHYIEEAEALCDRVAILAKGHLVDLDTPQRLRQKTDLPNLEEVFLALTAETKSKEGR